MNDPYVLNPNSGAPTKAERRSAYVVFHAGEAYNRDSVRWYSPFFAGEGERLYREYHNIGDSVVYDSTLKLLDFENFIEVDFNNPNPDTVDLIRASCSHGIIRGSNYFHSNMHWGRFTEFVEGIGLPMIVIGVGVQGPLGRSTAMGGESERAAQALGNLCVSIGVRGERTAQAFADIGVKNVRIVGCPSMFRNPKFLWEKRNWAPLPSIPTSGVSCGVTLRREIGPDYVENMRLYLDTQRSLILDASRQTQLRLFTQGELYEKYLFHGRVDLLETEFAEPFNQGWLKSPDDEIIQIYRKSLFYSDDIPTFCKVLADCQVVIGFRVHGVLPALAIGVPSVLVDYDSRTHELIKTFDLPHIKLEDCTFSDAYQVARTFDYHRVARAHGVVKMELLALLGENAAPSHFMSSQV